MDSTFIPQKIKVGFQERDDTYTGKLAYVIYFDEKGVLRKEKSWEEWRNKKISPVEFDNVPTEGFVLNKKVGGEQTDWHVRNTYVRVYDPRNFEFEITIPNLLYILENTSSIIGKGLEGKFVYGWDGTELLLIPTNNSTYDSLKKLQDLKFSKNFVKTKDLVIGATYLHKSNEPYVYMGVFDHYKDNWGDSKYTKNNHTFMHPDLSYYVDKDSMNDCIKVYKTLGDQFVNVEDAKCTPRYAELMEFLECLPCYSPYEHKKVFIEYTLEKFKEDLKRQEYINFYTRKKAKGVELKGLNHYFVLNGDYLYLCAGLYENDEGGFTCSEALKKSDFESLEKIFEKYKPYYERHYLKNGKISKI